MMAEVAAYFPGLAAPDTPWPLFLALYHRASRFEARRQLSGLLATGSAIGAAFGGETKGQVEDLIEQAYPVKREQPRWIANAFANGEPDDG